MPKNNGGYIYPDEWTVQCGMAGGEVIHREGITRRDWLAGLAMQGMLSNTSDDPLNAKAEFMAIAELAYKMG